MGATAREIKAEEAEVGDWAAYCCIEDLKEIEDDQELEDLRREIEQYGHQVRFWRTEEDARAELEEG